jgi:hypothetical protein
LFLDAAESLSPTNGGFAFAPVEGDDAPVKNA